MSQPEPARASQSQPETARDRQRSSAIVKAGAQSGRRPEWHIRWRMPRGLARLLARLEDHADAPVVILERIDGVVVLFDHEVQMGSGGIACRALQADDRARLDIVADLDAGRLDHVAVDRRDMVAVVDLDGPAQAE